MDRDAALAVVEQFYPNDLSEVFPVMGAPGVVIRACHQQAHAFFVVITFGEKVKPFLRDITGGSDFLKQFTAGYGRDEPHRLADVDSAAPAMILPGGFLHN
ncbi:MAG: hypothetical protein WAK48_10940 [Candidatus Acidiferrum sp.]